MTQSTKKSSAHAQSAAKLQSMAGKASRTAFSTVESTRQSTENVVRIGGAAMKDFLASSADEAHRAQEKAFAMGRESAESLAKSADSLSRMSYELVGMSRGNIETCMECGNMTAELAKDIGAELFDGANKAFADSLEISKEALACRTVSDVFELQNRALRDGMDQFFNQSIRLSNLFFEYSTEALEPINERVSQASEQLGKALAA